MSVEAMKQALDFIERINKDGWILADFEPQMYDTITSLRQAIAEAENQVSYSSNGTAGRENMTAPTGFFFQMPKAEKQDDELQKVHSALACAIWDRMEVEELLFKLTGVKLIPKSNTPQKRTWVGLTDEESVEIQKISICYEQAVELTEAKLKEKNA